MGLYCVYSFGLVEGVDSFLESNRIWVGWGGKMSCLSLNPDSDWEIIEILHEIFHN
jgi:hypothetical protein